MACRLIQADSKTIIWVWISSKKFNPISTRSVAFICFSCLLGKKETTSKEEAITTLIAETTTRLTKRNTVFQRLCLVVTKYMRCTLKFLAPSGDMENHLPLLTILKCSQESWFLQKDKRKGSIGYKMMILISNVAKNYILDYQGHYLI